MLDEASSILDRDRRDRRPQRLDQRLAGARLRLAQKALYLRERLLDGVVVRRVGWQEEQLAAPRLDQLAHLLALVRREVVRNYDLPGAKRGRQNPLDVKASKTSFVVPPTTAKHGPIPSLVMLAKSVVFLPRLRGTDQRARSPRRDQARRGASEVFAPISSTKTRRSASSPVSPATSARQAALSHSSRSLAPTVLFFGSIPSA